MEILKFRIENRKYLGSKFRLIPFLKEIILKKTPTVKTFIDGFSGTGVVSYYFRDHAEKIVANDILYSNYVINRAFLNNKYNAEKIRKILDELNSLQPVRGYCCRHFGGKYFTCENAGRIDAVRERIEEHRLKNSITEGEVSVLITCLLYAMDKAANTVGQYDAYMKHIGKKAYSPNGKHRVDTNVYKKLLLREPEREDKENTVCEVYNLDINKLIRNISGDVLYLDPPYNHRQYADLYHVLENVALWKKPPVSGKTCKFKRDHLKSLYSRKRAAESALRELICNADVKYIVLSYNNEGFLSENSIKEILEQRGPVEISKTEYPVFGGGAGQAVKRAIKEKIFFCTVR
jgi:adenine-specific DNA-methyltransferase